MTWAEILGAAEAVREGFRGAAEAPRSDIDVAEAPILRLPIGAIGWATVDEERARRELDALLAADPSAPDLRPWAPVERAAALGARGWERTPRVGGQHPALVVLEPDTEGRIAAYLARFGEGVGVIYLGAGRMRAGRIVRGGPAWGPFVGVLDADEP